ncbi:MAG TPA: DUF4870 domain-containing protein [Pyrinomonadaceae bacterium]|nr:DUF4870 domain-containing protein [Pyrinomonadaceae bacterium]
METKKSKYDTNPLDPEVESKAEESWGSGAPTQQVKGATREVGRSANEQARQNTYSEAPTRRYDTPPLDASYPSVFVPPTYNPPAQYPHQQPAPHPTFQQQVTNPPTSRPVIGLGLPEKWAVLLAYAPYVGLVASLVELFLVSRREVRVRFHAAQALALHIAILILGTVFGVIGAVSGSGLGELIFKIATMVFLILSMVRVWRGEPHRIAPLAEPAQWFNDHIDPRTQG